MRMFSLRVLMFDQLMGLMLTTKIILLHLVLIEGLIQANRN